MLQVTPVSAQPAELRLNQGAAGGEHPSATRSAAKTAVLLGDQTLETAGGRLLMDEVLKAGAKLKILRGWPHAHPRLERLLRDHHDKVGGQIEVIEARAWPHPVWLRDWTPVLIDGVFYLFDYNQSTLYRPRELLFDRDSMIPDLERILGPVLSRDLVLEGGNFFKLADGRCLTSARVLFMNDQEGHPKRPLYDGEYPQAPLEKVRRVFDSLGCRETTIFPLRPFDLTQHVDMWLNPLDDHRIVVGAIRDRTIDHLEQRAAAGELKPVDKDLDGRQVDVLEINRATQKYLDEQAERLGNLGYEVIRAPMPAVGNWSNQGSFGSSLINALIVGNVVLAPHYDPYFLDPSQYPDVDLMPEHQAEYERIMRGLGYDVKWIPAHDLIRRGGSLHCASREYLMNGAR